MDVLTPRQLFLLLFWSFLSLTILLVYLSAAKTIRKRKQKRLIKSKEACRLALFNYLRDDSAEFQYPGRHALSELLLEYSNVLQDEDMQIRMTALAEKHLSGWLKKELKSFSWSSRMNALYIIENIRLYHLLEEVKQLAGKRHLTTEEEAVISRILASSGDEGFLKQIINSSRHLSDFTILSILQNCGPDHLRTFYQTYGDLPERLRYNLITLIGDLQLFEQKSLIEQLLMKGDEEEKLRSLKAAADMVLPIKPDIIAPFIYSPDWLERMMALKVIGSLRSEVFLDAAKDLLSDKEYMVRLEAAKTIFTFKNGKQLLEEVIYHSDDLFARDMALEWISKGGGRNESVRYNS
ncbi:HEAT repeat domain-containing protein [Metabacillus indicus]|uniref:HEAT repeat domain-containing protein n=1 Tax=Metabacillus indicus TaxID=246786 RepID=UPI002A084F11|nr:HEAT repeat domain-containing protein [Metabacillus indicus]MDX8290306.1 HEAT repeat domain-containing protein [Metabacillus indicus]